MSDNNIPAKLQKLRKIQQACISMKGYSPTQEMIKLETLYNRLSSIEKLDNYINDTIKNLKPVQKQRSELVNSKEQGISKIIAEVRKYVRGNYGVNSEEWNSIKNIKA